MRNNPEYQLAKAISQYLKARYPKVLFRYDQAGLHLTKAQAGQNKAIQNGRAWPDLFIAKPKHHRGFPESIYYGLFIELKAERTKLYKKDGTPKTPHIAEQMQCLQLLETAGFKAVFGVGFDHCKKIIDEYLS